MDNYSNLEKMNRAKDYMEYLNEQARYSNLDVVIGLPDAKSDERLGIHCAVNHNDVLHLIAYNNACSFNITLYIEVCEYSYEDKIYVYFQDTPAAVFEKEKLQEFIYSILSGGYCEKTGKKVEYSLGYDWQVKIQECIQDVKDVLSYMSDIYEMTGKKRDELVKQLDIDLAPKAFEYFGSESTRFNDCVNDSIA
jgi:hypothetical protein